METKMKIYLKNETDKLIDICCGADQEFTLEPGERMTVKVQDEDYFYIDQVIEKDEKRGNMGGED